MEESGAAESDGAVNCGTEVSITTELLDRIDDYATAPLGSGDAVLAARLDGGDEILVFVRRAGNWRAYSLAQNGGVEALYRSAQGDAFVWAYEGRGDPPFAFTGLHVPAGASGDQYCTRFDVPGDLNKPGWQGEAFAFDLFNVAESGDGAIVGSSEVERDGQAQSWTFRYDSQDGGRTWTEPVRIEPLQSLPGLYERVEEQDAGLIDDLRNSAS